MTSLPPPFVFLPCSSSIIRQQHHAGPRLDPESHSRVLQHGSCCKWQRLSNKGLHSNIKCLLLMGKKQLLETSECFEWPVLAGRTRKTLIHRLMGEVVKILIYSLRLPPLDFIKLYFYQCSNVSLRLNVIKPLISLSQTQATYLNSKF